MQLRYLLPLVLVSASSWSCKSQQESEPLEPPLEVSNDTPEEQARAAAVIQQHEQEVAEQQAKEQQAREEQLRAERRQQEEAEQAAREQAQAAEKAAADAAAEEQARADALRARTEAEARAQAEEQARMSAQHQELQSQANRLAVLEQRRASLAQKYVETGDSLLEMADLRGALEQYSEALEVVSGHASAADQREVVMGRLAKVRALMGDEYAQAGLAMEDAAARLTVKNAQARLAAEEASVAGDNALRAKDYDTAITRYREAETILRYNPLLASATLDEQILRNKIESAARLAGEEHEAVQREKSATAKAAQLKAEEAARNYRENYLKQLYTEAFKAFQAENYSLSEQLANQILQADAGNPHAEEMRDVSRAARHKAADEITLRKLREEWIKTFEDLDQLSDPQTQSVVFNDLERWKMVSLRKPPAFRTADPSIEAEKTAILRHLDEVMIAPRFGTVEQGVALSEVANFLQGLTGINFLISAKVNELDEEARAVYLETGERSVRSVLDLISDTKESIKWKVEDGMVKLVTADELKGGQVLKMYEVNDLIRAVRDFPGREINLIPSNGLEKSDEKVEEREAMVVTSDNLDQMIRQNVAPESWDADPANSLKISNGTMIVNQKPEVHEKIEKLLADLREATGIMVDIQARFLKVEDNFLEDIGVDFRGLGAPGKGNNGNFNDFGDATAQGDLGNSIGQDTSYGLFYDDGQDGSAAAHIENLYDSDLGSSTFKPDGGLSFQWTFLNDLEMQLILRAVSKSERVQLVTAPRVLVFNTARANLTVLNQVAYVRDYDVEIAQGASIADPIVDVVQDGVVLDVKPVVWADRRFLTLEVRPTVAELTRPIPEFPTTLGTQTAVTLQLPALELSRVRTTLPMPDGGTVLLGGFKVHNLQDMHSGIPILNKIPFLSFLFDRKGNYVSNRKLLVLLKANIVIPTEKEPTQAQLGNMPGVTTMK